MILHRPTCYRSVEFTSVKSPRGYALFVRPQKPHLSLRLLSAHLATEGERTAFLRVKKMINQAANYRVGFQIFPSHAQNWTMVLAVYAIFLRPILRKKILETLPELPPKTFYFCDVMVALLFFWFSWPLINTFVEVRKHKALYRRLINQRDPLAPLVQEIGQGYRAIGPALDRSVDWQSRAAYESALDMGVSHVGTRLGYMTEGEYAAGDEALLALIRKRKANFYDDTKPGEHGGFKPA